MSVAKKTVLITGGNSGIGRETAVALASQGGSITITSRDPEKGKRAVEYIREESGSEVALLALDLASFASIRQAAADLLASHDQLHVLVNNAGPILSQRSETQEGFETTFGVNHLGHFLLTQLLLDRIIASAPARIVNVSSDAHRFARKGLDFDDLQSTHGYGGLQVYGRSKLANIYFTRELARRLEGTGVTVNAIHPGGVATGFAQEGDVKGVFSALFKIARPFLRSPAKGAETVIYAASAPELDGITGKYFKDLRQGEVTKLAQDEQAAGKLWALSQQLVASHTSAT